MMMRALLFLSVLVALVSCDRTTQAVRETKELAKDGLAWSEQKAKNGVVRMADHVFVTCHPYKPDTERNRMRFEEYFDPKLVPDALEIYAYTDYYAIDYTVMFSFRCDTASLARIIRDNDLTLYQDSTGMRSSPGLSGTWDFPWWDEIRLRNIRPFVRDIGRKDHIVLWYDTLEHRVTYQQYSL